MSTAGLSRFHLIYLCVNVVSVHESICITVQYTWLSVCVQCVCCFVALLVENINTQTQFLPMCQKHMSHFNALMPDVSDVR